MSTTLKTYSEAELKEILAGHDAWVQRMRAKHGFYISYTWDIDADQEGRANLVGANLVDANLRGANLVGANLERANLVDANLRGANLERANLVDANLRGANLERANLERANLVDANLRGANLRGANLRGANLVDAKISNETLIRPACTLPEEGSFIAFKKVLDVDGKDIVLKLEIMGKSVSSFIGRKCRADQVRVIAAYGPLGGERTGKFYSKHNRKFVYEVGSVISEPGFDPNPRVECTSGIHFFMTRAEAEAYE